MIPLSGIIIIDPAKLSSLRHFTAMLDSLFDHADLLDSDGE